MLFYLKCISFKQGLLCLLRWQRICLKCRDSGSIPWSECSPGKRNGNSLQYYCLVYPVDRGAWWCTVYGVAKNQTWLSSWTTTANDAIECWSVPVVDKCFIFNCIIIGYYKQPMRYHYLYCEVRKLMLRKVQVTYPGHRTCKWLSSLNPNSVLITFPFFTVYISLFHKEICSLTCFHESIWLRDIERNYLQTFKGMWIKKNKLRVLKSFTMVIYNVFH